MEEFDAIIVNGKSYNCIESREIEVNEIFIQLDGGDSKPILRKRMPDSDTLESMYSCFEKNGYYPVSKSFDYLEGVYKIIN